MSAWSLDGRVALVTGAGRGIGRACAVELARAGATVLCMSRTAAELDELVAEIGGAAFVGDVTDEAAVAAAVKAAEDLGDLRVALACAGTNRPGPARDYPLKDWDVLFDVNVRATFITCRAVGDSLLRRGVPGSIVTMSSQMAASACPAASPTARPSTRSRA